VATVNGKKDKVFGVDHDPDDRLKMTSDRDGYPIATRDGKHITPVDFVDATQENIERMNQGKQPKSFKLFSGYGRGTLKKSYE
tara:strand:+ start:242 stop:490 length:249 start_codon:yes stop_codon:yes gene_type:complete